MKRMIDLIISLMLLIVFSPILLVVGVMVRFKMGSPILFTQKRPGLYGKPFNLYKFRTMVDLKDSNGELLPDELRLTNFGKFLRKFSLDEFPQLINVVKGEMSLVGPRPLLMEYLSLYTKEQMLRHDVRPGITGWAQVNGRNAITWEEKFKFDNWYVENQNLKVDLKILFLTFIKVIKKEGISQQGQVTMEKFKGSYEVM
ncbi:MULTISPECIES: sugar transferase [Bacillaceae]|uniref:sugar transferase n=1 Tax=Bacillaceae TaxID=186817 RepID=UPI000BEBDC0D|nr:MULTISPECIES: sugar transferase [unclassified Bacillus (in: firmicutes)]PEC50516.1 sugar transferase [Bacillus sp. AFS096315]PFM81951.1 sugar transferase [Bacillus sp. AFS077874]